jgi:hypothetical protein
MQKHHLRTPKIRSMTFRACACRKLKSSSLFAGLAILLQLYCTPDCKRKTPTTELHIDVQPDDNELHDMAQAIVGNVEILHLPINSIHQEC